MDGKEDIVRLSHEPLQVEECLAAVRSPSAGAISTFIGTTRDHFQGKRVLKLCYEAYEQMALSEMYNVLKQVRERWDIQHVAIYHRLGEVPIGEASVIIAASSCHRREALDAVSFAIDTLKATVPIWKKEVYADGDATWKENSECAWLLPKKIDVAVEDSNLAQAGVSLSADLPEEDPG